MKRLGWAGAFEKTSYRVTGRVFLRHYVLMTIVPRRLSPCALLGACLFLLIIIVILFFFFLLSPFPPFCFSKKRKTKDKQGVSTRASSIENLSSNNFLLSHSLPLFALAQKGRGQPAADRYVHLAKRGTNDGGSCNQASYIRAFRIRISYISLQQQQKVKQLVGVALDWKHSQLFPLIFSLEIKRGTGR